MNVNRISLIGNPFNRDSTARVESVQAKEIHEMLTDWAHTYLR